MKLLRDKKKVTKFLILYYSSLNKPNKLAEIAREYDMTEQGVSNYISEMVSDGLMDKSGDYYHPTPDGMEFVRDILSELSAFLDDAVRSIEIISNCTAIADEDIEKGERVGLYMKNGFLHASKAESSSMGKALQGVKKGQPLQVGGLHGITEMELGTIFLIKSDVTGKIDDVRENLEKQLQNISFDLVGVTGEGQYGILKEAGIEPDIVFSPIESAINAAERGLDVVLITSESSREKAVERIRTQNKGREKEYQISCDVL
ncbi:MAG: hypothetical protein R6U61_03870 [Thermoplasmata archaeon]